MREKKQHDETEDIEVKMQMKVDQLEKANFETLLQTSKSTAFSIYKLKFNYLK